MEFLLSDLRGEFDPINSSMSSTIGGLGCHDAADGWPFGHSNRWVCTRASR